MKKQKLYRDAKGRFISNKIVKSTVKPNKNNILDFGFVKLESCGSKKYSMESLVHGKYYKAGTIDKKYLWFIKELQKFEPTYEIILTPTYMRIGDLDKDIFYMDYSQSILKMYCDYTKISKGKASSFKLAFIDMFNIKYEKFTRKDMEIFDNVKNLFDCRKAKQEIQNRILFLSNEIERLKSLVDKDFFITPNSYIHFKEDECGIGIGLKDDCH